MAPVRQVGVTILEADFVERHRTPWEVSLFLLRRIRHRAARVMESGGPPGNSFDRFRAARTWSGCLQTETPSFAEGAEETGRSTAVVCQVLRMSVSGRRCSHSCSRDGSVE